MKSHENEVFQIFESFSSPNNSKFAAECDRKSSISQLRTKFGFLWKKLGFWEKKLFSFKIGKSGKFVVSSV